MKYQQDIFKVDVVQGPYSPVILKNVLSIFLQVFFYILKLLKVTRLLIG